MYCYLSKLWYTVFPYNAIIAIFKKNEASWGFPGGAVVENLPANAGDTGSSPGLGRPHMPRSNWARELQMLGLRIWSLFSAQLVTVPSPEQPDPTSSSALLVVVALSPSPQSERG